MRKPTTTLPLAPHKRPFASPFAALAGTRCRPAEASEEPVASPTPRAAPEGGAADIALVAGVVLRLVEDCRGHRGKTVTRILGLPRDARQLTAVARHLSRSLGCGARVVGDEILLQGSPGERAAALLRGLGARVA